MNSTNINKIEINNIPKEELFQDLILELKLRNYSNKTIKSYVYHNYNFLIWFKQLPIKVKKMDIENYLKCIVINKNINGAHFNIIKNSLKFYYEQIRNKKFKVRHKSAKIQNKVIFVLSKEEVAKLIDNTNNLKHKLLIKLLYSSGLRISECIKIKHTDLDLLNKIGILRKGKGNKDRLFKLTSSVVNHISNLKSNSIYLFYSNHNKNKHISVRTAQEIITNAKSKAKINKDVYPHLLRHSFATHLIETEVPITDVQKLLGHQSIRTTQNYTKSSRVMFNKIPELI